MYQILVAHDLSARSDVALARAARLALDRDGHLTILHVVDSDLPPAVIEAQRALAESHLERELRRLLGRERPPCRIATACGDPASAIAEQAESQAVELVVVGRHRRRVVADMFLGTTVARLIRQIRRPILVAGNPNLPLYRRVLIPVDFSNASTAAIRLAMAFVPKARLHLLHAYKGPYQDYVATLSLTFSREERAKFAGSIGEHANQAMSRLIDALSLAERKPAVTIKNGDVLQVIQEELARQETDLVVMGSHARSGVAHVLIGSMVEAVLETSMQDMLVVPVPEVSPVVSG